LPLALALAQTTVLLGLLAPDGRLTFANARALETIGASTADVAGMPFWDSPWWRDDAVARARLRLALPDVVRTARPARIETLYVTPWGAARRVAFTLTPLRNGAGTTLALLAEGHDVTEQRAAEQAIAEARRRTELILAAAADGIIGVDADGVVTFVNAAAAAQLERTTESMLGRPLGDVLDCARRCSADDPCPTLTAIGTGLACEGEDAYRRADGSAFPADFSVRPLVAAGVRSGAVLTFRDVTDRKAVERQLLALSYFDELTGVHNRRGFVPLARQELLRARRAGLPVLLCYLDLDRFKHINDTYGHGVGDVALRHLADALRSTFRESDVVGRVGGDEFVALAPAAGAVNGADGFEAVIDAWRARLECALADQPGREVYGGAPLSVSVGWVVSTPDDERPLEALMEEADAALYARKRARHRTSVAATRASAAESSQSINVSSEPITMSGPALRAPAVRPSSAGSPVPPPGR
jgi:diguanylate cyclase (GGDEF)-like protein/PAS domain S-box-containing protein